AVQAWLLGRSAKFRDAIEVVVIDPHAGYAAAVRAALPNARIAVDHFHLIMLANRAVTAVRQRITRDLLAPPRPRDRPDVGEPPPAAARP
ncbi:MAG: transposase, partial [Pseudonocardiales bacterium]|nr:transposase [Pseudonocardiales bacterium]